MIICSCRGRASLSLPEDLPKILNQITLAYKQQLEADSQSVGQESKELIEKLESQLSQEKQEAETRYVQLYRELGITTTDNQGKVVNPYNKKLFSLSDDLDAVRRSIRGLEDRLALLKEAVDSGDENQMKVVAMEAKDYLGLARSQYRDHSVNVNENQTMRLPGLPSRNDLESKIWAIDNKINDLKFTRMEQSAVLGRGHKKIKSLDQRIAFFQKQRQELQTQLDVYTTELKKLEKEAELQLADSEENPQVDLTTFRKQEERQWVMMYHLALQRELKRLQLGRDAWSRSFRPFRWKPNGFPAG